jgi:hypothetical protein
MTSARVPHLARTAAVAALAMLSSCIQYVKGDVDEPPRIHGPSAGSKKDTASYELSLFEHPVPDQGEPPEFARFEHGDYPPFKPGTAHAEPWAVVACTDALRDVLMSSGYFETVEESVERGGVHFQVTVVEHGSSTWGMAPGPWTAVALVLPVWAEEKRLIHVEVFHDNDPTRAFDFSERFETMAWTPLMLVAPFQSSPRTRHYDMYKRVFGTVLLRLEQDGVLAKSS